MAWRRLSGNLYWMAVSGHYHLHGSFRRCRFWQARPSRALLRNSGLLPGRTGHGCGMGIIGAASVPAIAYLIMAFAVRTTTLDFFRLCSGSSRNKPNDRIFVWGSYPLSSTVFPDGGLATRFVSCTHLVGAYAQPSPAR